MICHWVKVGLRLMQITTLTKCKITPIYTRCLCKNPSFYTPWFALLILHCNPALWLAERAPASFSHCAETNDFARTRFRFKMSDVVKKTQGKMALIFLSVWTLTDMTRDYIYTHYSSPGSLKFIFLKVDQNQKLLLNESIGHQENIGERWREMWGK